MVSPRGASRIDLDGEEHSGHIHNSSTELSIVGCLEPQAIQENNRPKHERNDPSLILRMQSNTEESSGCSPNNEPNGREDSRPVWLRGLEFAKWFIADQYFLFSFGLVILIASHVQVSPSGESRKELVTSYLCVTVIFLITGATIPTKVLLQNSSKWKVHIFVQVQSYLMTSAIVYAVVSLCATNRHFMDGGLLIGMILMGVVPTTISSNIIMTRRAHGNDALTTVES
jgi:solute carrier family 10 (sodium/bile acid cotransporter), member 7